MQLQRDLILPTLSAIAESIVLGVVVRAILAGGLSAPPIPLLTLIVVAGALVMRRVAERDGAARSQQIALLGGAAVTAVATFGLGLSIESVEALAAWAREPFQGFPAAAAFLVSGLVAWWRGTRIGETRVEGGHADERLRWGIGLLAVASFVSATAARNGGPNIAGELPGAVAAYFLVALCSLAIARMNQMGMGFSNPGSALGWAGVFAVAGGAIVLVGFAIALAMPGPSRLLGEGLRAAAMNSGWVDPFIRWLLTPLALLLEGLFDGFGQFDAFFERMRRFAEALMNVTPQEEQEPRAPIEPFSEVVIAASQWLMILLGLSLAAFLAWRLVRRRRARVAPGYSEVRESVFSWSDLGGALKSLFRRSERPVPEELRDKTPAAEEVRRAYKDFQHAALLHGWRRRPSQTPFEFLRNGTLGESDSASELTDLYVAVRYAEADVADADAARARALVERFDAEQKAKSARAAIT